jgi:hypothetical protein
MLPVEKPPGALPMSGVMNRDRTHGNSRHLLVCLTSGTGGNLVELARRLDPRQVVADVHARHYGAEINDPSLTPVTGRASAQFASRTGSAAHWSSDSPRPPKRRPSPKRQSRTSNRACSLRVSSPGVMRVRLEKRMSLFRSLTSARFVSSWPRP